MPLPRIVWLNTAMLVLASVALQCAVSAVRQSDTTTMRLSLVTGGVATAAFLAGQLVAWQQHAAAGYLLAGGPANSFFYALTGLHGLHLIGGLVALAGTGAAAWGVVPAANLRIRVELCAMYWHFLLLIWLLLLVVLSGRANDLINICRQILT
jgi:cytochrome c oxidase subunit 3